MDPDPDELAAALAAIERFLAATRRRAAVVESTPDPWLRVARAEAVGTADEAAPW